MDIQNIKKQLSAAYPYRVELHAHSKPASSCSQVPAVKLVENFKAAGYDAVTLTNHFSHRVLITYYKTEDKRTACEMYLEDYRKAKEAGERLGIQVYLGAELRFEPENNNDYLLFGIDEEMIYRAYDYMDTDLETFVTKGKSDRSVLVQAHPFRDNMARMEPRLLDGLEVFNMHPGHNSRVVLAQQFAGGYQLKLKTIGTDYHYEGHENLCAARFPALPADSFALAQALKSGDYLMEIGENLILP